MTPEDMDQLAERAEAAARVATLMKDRDRYQREAADWREKARRARGGEPPAVQGKTGRSRQFESD